MTQRKLTPEEVELKKEQMRQYMAADRKLDDEKEKRRRGRSRGCLGNLLRLVAVAAAIGGVCYLIWLWHPWGRDVVARDAKDVPEACTPGTGGQVTEEYFTLFGHRLYKSGGATICYE